MTNKRQVAATKLAHSSKNYGAEILRGIAILMVVSYHIFGPLFGWSLPWKGLLRDFQSQRHHELLWFYPVTFGWAGVALFFVLSGFCIHLSFLRSKSFNAGHFFWRRFWRIYPAYAIALVVFTALNHVNIFSLQGAMQFLTHALFLHNLRGSTFMEINGSFWSIATEMQLYILFPLLLFIRSRLRIEGCILITLIIGLIWRGLAVYFWGIPEHIITPALSSPLMTWFDWTLGAYVAERLYHDRQAFSRKRVWLAVLLPLFVASTLFKPFTLFSFSLAAVTSAVVLDSALHVYWRKGFMITSLSLIGLLSYSLYLWHQPLVFRVHFYLFKFIGSSVVAWFLLIPIVITGSWVSFRFFEQIGILIGDSIWNRLINRTLLPAPDAAQFPFKR